MNMFERGANRLQNRLRDKCGATIAYSRKVGSITTTKTVKAVIGKFHFVIDRGGGEGVVHAHSRDYIVLASALDTFGDPRPGDKIAETIDGVARNYEVMAPDGEQPWRWSDEYSIAYRIHTKEI
jgi:hypothetical protein